MVRHGRLSKGCQTCRKRKIKCDERRPSCSQFRRAGWICPQYGDSVVRMFQYHDTERFTQHQRPLESGHTVKILERKKPIGLSSHVNWEAIPWNYVPCQIQQTLNDRAIDYFLATNTFRDDASLRGFYEYLPSYEGLQTRKEVLASLTATSLAAYGNRFRHDDILKQARQYYGRSLRLVNRALQSTDAARKAK
ncbi:hypothetical protein BDW62DRAFT_197899 [Aspergillus aurantiobrunneus]